MSNKMINHSNTKTGTHKTKYSSRLQREPAKAILASVQPRRDPHKSTGIAHADPLNKSSRGICTHDTHTHIIRVTAGPEDTTQT